MTAAPLTGGPGLRELAMPPFLRSPALGQVPSRARDTGGRPPSFPLPGQPPPARSAWLRWGHIEVQTADERPRLRPPAQERLPRDRKAFPPPRGEGKSWLLAAPADGQLVGVDQEILLVREHALPCGGKVDAGALEDRGHGHRNTPERRLEAFEEDLVFGQPDLAERLRHVSY